MGNPLKGMALIAAATIFAAATAMAGQIVELLDGRKAEIEGKKLFLVDMDSRRIPAPEGSYETKDERTILVKGNGIEILSHVTKPR